MLGLACRSPLTELRPGPQGPTLHLEVTLEDHSRNLLRLRPELAIAYWDERLSSAAVNRMLIGEADLTRARRADLVDKAAAAYILQGALDRLG